MLKIRVDSHDDISAFLRDEKDVFFEAIIEAISDGWVEKLDRVPVAEFVITDSDSILSIDIEEEDWNESLYLALYHFESAEDYERCIELQNLIDDIYND